MLKKRMSIILLVIFSLISWGIWIIEVNPFFTNTWDWTNEMKITFILVPLLFILWGYISNLIKKISFVFLDLLIFVIFFSVILSLIIIVHVKGFTGLVILCSPFFFLLYKPVSLIFISLLTFGFNFLIMKVNKVEITKRDLCIIYFTFYIIPIVMFFISFLFKLFNANEYIIGFSGFNNMDSMLWFKSGIIIPIVFIYEGLLVMIKTNLEVL